MIMRFSFRTKGDFSKTRRFINRVIAKKYLKDLDNYGRIGVEKLSEATPKQTGATANSWNYRIEDNGKTVSLIWYNTSMTTDGRESIAILLQYGHGTGTGGYVQGRDYINPAIQSVFDDMAEAAWRVITES